MKLPLIKDIDRKTSIPKSETRKAVEKVYGVKLNGNNDCKPAKGSAAKAS